MRSTNVITFPFLGLIFFLYLAILLPSKAGYLFFEDDFRHLEIATRIPAELSSIFVTEQKGHRKHPFYNCFLFAEKYFLGRTTQLYFLMHFVIHFSNAILLICLAKKLEMPSSAAYMAGFLFLVTSSFYNIMIKLTGTLELLGLCFFLLSAIMWLRFLKRSKRLTLIYFTPAI